MKEFIKGSSKPKDADTLECRVAKLITTNLVFTKGGSIVNVGDISDKHIIKLTHGQYISPTKRTWNHEYEGYAQITIDNLTQMLDIRGYIDIDNGKCIEIDEVVQIS